jgi:hypothetical protein
LRKNIRDANLNKISYVKYPFSCRFTEAPALFSRKVKELVKIIKGDGFDGGDSDDNEFDDNDYQSSDGHEYRIAISEGNKFEEKAPFTAEVCRTIARILIATRFQQIQIIERDINKMSEQSG